MAAASIDALTAATLKHLREHWWGPDFTDFLKETLKPRPGNRILDVGCGTGTGEVSIGRLHISQLRLIGVDLIAQKVAAARQQTAAHNLRAGFAVADACHLPFGDAVFDSTYCVAVLQHITDIDAAVTEFARVTRPNGRVLAVEPDNSARFWYSSTDLGMKVAETSARFFAAIAQARGDAPESAVGPKLPELFSRHGIEPLDVRLFPVSQARLGSDPDPVWQERRTYVERAIADAPNDDVRALGREYLGELNAYAKEAAQAGPSFVEIQNTLLFATVGQKNDD